MGWCVHVHATTHQGVEATRFAAPAPPYPAITELVERYLGPVPRAGRAMRRTGKVAQETEIYRTAGFTGPATVRGPGAVR